MRLRFSQRARHELESFEKHFDMLNDTVSKVNFAAKIELLAPTEP
jgi:hypothetical protein